MPDFIERLDGAAGIESNGAASWLERAAFVFLLLTLAAAPHSIAATQTAWGIGMLAWIVRLFLKPRPQFRLGPIDAALWGLFAWSVISSLVSYEPLVSLDKLRGAAVFLIFYFAYYNLRTRRAVAMAACVLIGSCMVNVLWMPVERLIGRGVEVHGLEPDGPLARALLWDGDTLLEVNRKRVSTPQDVVTGIRQSEVAKVKFYRPDFEYTVDVKSADLLPGENALEQLGAGSWKKSHNWRSKGFYGHYTTYAEVLQLIGSLAFGLLVAGIGRNRGVGESRSGGKALASSLLNSPTAPLLIAVAGIAFALLLTVTRGPQLAFVISCAAIVLLGLGRKWFLTAAVVLIPIAIGGLVFLQQSRGVDFFDSKDESTRYRQMMWRDGVRLWSESPRHFIFGVGMDSAQKRWREWDMFERGRQPLGHFHSTPVQLVAERGLPALLLWVLVVGLFAGRLWNGLAGPTVRKNVAVEIRDDDPWLRGIMLGSLGGLLGFTVSGLVHYNLGDQEVAMVFFLIMGLGARAVDERLTIAEEA